jgi:hypothetical protein
MAVTPFGVGFRSRGPVHKVGGAGKSSSRRGAADSQSPNRFRKRPSLSAVTF